MKRKPSAKRVVLTLFSLLVAILAFSYVRNSFSSVFGRSVGSVSGTDWISFSGGTVSFSEGTGTLKSPEESLTFSYEERDGIIKATYESGSSAWFTRRGSDQLTTGDGRTVYYLYTKGGSL